MSLQSYAQEQQEQQQQLPTNQDITHCQSRKIPESACDAEVESPRPSTNKVNYRRAGRINNLRPSWNWTFI